MSTMSQIPIQYVTTTSFSDQRPGTSGLRKKTQVFMQPHYLENFVQAVFNTIQKDSAHGLTSGKKLSSLAEMGATTTAKPSSRLSAWLPPTDSNAF